MSDSEKNKAQIKSHLKAREADSANFLLFGEEGVSFAQNRITVLGIYNILARIATQKVNVVAIGCKDIGGYLEGLRRILRDVLKYVIITKENIDRDMREFMNAFRQIATSA